MTPLATPIWTVKMVRKMIDKIPAQYLRDDDPKVVRIRFSEKADADCFCAMLNEVGR